MKLRIAIQMDNTAFEDPSEIGRILQQFGDQVANGMMLSPEHSAPLLDINGNKVGKWKVTP